MSRLNRLLNEKNKQHIERTLANLETASYRFKQLESLAANSLSELPGLMGDARQTLKNVNQLSTDIGELVQQMKIISPKLDKLAASGGVASELLITRTLPRINVLLLELQSTIQHIKQVATLLENDPQAFLLGREILQPGPGEPGFEEP